MEQALSSFPDDPMTLWKDNLAYFEYEVDQGDTKPDSFEQAIETGIVRLIPQKYEDFFGPAATNIFNSNIGLEDVANAGIAKPDSLEDFEAQLGRKVIDMYQYYDQIENNSREAAKRKLGL